MTVGGTRPWLKHTADGGSSINLSVFLNQHKNICYQNGVSRRCETGNENDAHSDTGPGSGGVYPCHWTGIK